MMLSKTRLYILVLLVSSLLHLPELLSQSPSPGANSKNNKNRVLRVDGLDPPFKTWLDQDAVWIITPDEKVAFQALQNDEQRDQFVEAFWSRRDPTPDTYENEFKEEHYRRVAYANDHYGWEGLGSKSDRGRIYIVYGPPDHITTYSTQDVRPPAQDGQNYNGLPSEIWSYRYLEGVGVDVVIDFVDLCNCGDYRMRMPDEIRDALLYIGAIDKNLGKINPDLYLKPVLNPKLKFRDLEAMLDSKSKVQALPLEVSSQVAKATDVTSIAHVTISLHTARTSATSTEVTSPATLKVLGRLKSLTGHVVELFEDEVAVNQSSPADVRIQKSIPLFNAHYRLEIAAEIGHTGNATIWTGILNVRP
jgi:GWxTD domain-containing protein